MLEGHGDQRYAERPSRAQSGATLAVPTSQVDADREPVRPCPTRPSHAGMGGPATLTRTETRERTCRPPTKPNPAGPGDAAGGGGRGTRTASTISGLARASGRRVGRVVRGGERARRLTTTVSSVT